MASVGSAPVGEAESRRSPKLEKVHEATYEDTIVRNVGEQQRHVLEVEGYTGGDLASGQFEDGSCVERRKHGGDAPRLRAAAGGGVCGRQGLPQHRYPWELHARRSPGPGGRHKRLHQWGVTLLAFLGLASRNYT